MAHFWLLVLNTVEQTVKYRAEGKGTRACFLRFFITIKVAQDLLGNLQTRDNMLVRVLHLPAKVRRRFEHKAHVMSEIELLDF